MENLVMFNDIYKNKKVLITGHTGFKGSYLALWLKKLDANVFGISLPPQDDINHWKLINIDMDSHYFDIRDKDKLSTTIREIKPDIIFHLAAQALVITSYSDPIDTWHSNLIGTVNVLESSRDVDGLKAVVCITTDKCYKNIDKLDGYSENDALGGYDPYSASKAACEIAISSYRDSYFTNTQTLIASARSGNVIGGGDWCKDRLIPDLIRSVDSGKPLNIRSPKATRPWHHVLETASGYLRLGQCLLEGNENCAKAYNFGPKKDNNCSVETILKKIEPLWDKVKWKIDTKNWPHEASELYLNSSQSYNELKWYEVWNIDDALRHTIEWYKSWDEKNLVISTDQLNLYIETMKKEKIDWIN